MLNIVVLTDLRCQVTNSSAFAASHGKQEGLSMFLRYIRHEWLRMRKNFGRFQVNRIQN